MKSEQSSVTLLGKISRSKHDEDAIEALEERFKDEDSGSTMRFVEDNSHQMNANIVVEETSLAGRSSPRALEISEPNET